MDGELIAVEQSTASLSINLVKDESVTQTENKSSLAILHQVLHNNPKPLIIRDKRYLEYEEWIALGNAFGLTVDTGDSEPVEVFEAKGFKAKARVIRVADGMDLGGAEAYCLDNEENWLNKDYYQMASMAQTRAGSKALANKLRGVVALDKSLSATPADEMRGFNTEPQAAPTKSPPTQAPTKAAPTPAPQPKTGKATSTLGNKPKAPKAPKPPVDDEAIEVEAKEVKKDVEGMSLKEIIDSNPHIRSAVDELQAQGTTPNRDNIKAKLLDFNDMGKITIAEYKQCKELLE